MASDNAMALAPQLGPLVLKMAGHARSVTLAQAARQTPKVLPELLRGNAEMHAVMLWVNQGGSVDACDEDGVSLLMRQVNQGKLQLAERLLQMHASVDAVDKRGRTALMSASGSGREEEVGLLLHYKASINLVDSSGYTALLRASCMGRADCVKRLLGARGGALTLTPTLTLTLTPTLSLTLTLTLALTPTLTPTLTVGAGDTVSSAASSRRWLV